MFAEDVVATVARKGGARITSGFPGAEDHVIFDRPVSISMVRLEEPIERGQVVRSFVLSGSVEGSTPTEIVRGTTIGHARLERFAARTVTQVTLSFDCAGEPPPLAIKLYA
jgi:hypothetical protein